jgi:hypothetical protein
MKKIYRTTVLLILLTNFTDSFAQVCFDSGTNYGLGSGSTQPWGIATDDFNGDGFKDLVVSNSSLYLSFLPGSATGTFGIATTFSYTIGGGGTGREGIVTYDFNGDGFKDVALTASSVNWGFVVVFLGTGTGSFSTPNFYNINSGNADARYLALNDFNMDGKMDLVVSSSFGSTGFSFLSGNGLGAFAFAGFTNVGSSFGITSADFNADGKADVAVVASNNVFIYTGNGSGTFTYLNNYSAGTTSYEVKSGDFNNDSKLDLAVLNYGSANVSIFLGNGAGAFGAPSNFSTLGSPRCLVVNDFNGDGKLDLAAGLYNYNVSVLIGTGTGSFAAPVLLSATTIYPQFGITSADFNGDGRMDIAYSGYNSNLAGVFLNKASAINITGISSICSGGNTTLTASGTTSYTWSANAGNATTSTVNVSPITNTTYTVFGSVAGCTIIPSNTITVTVNNVPNQPGTIVGNNTICNGSINTYSIPIVLGATSYTWSLPGGWSGASSTNTINTTASSTSGNLTVTATNACGTSVAQTLSVTVNTVPSAPGTISGNIFVCSGSSSTYSVAAVAGATAYTWVKPGGWTGASTTNTISATASATSGTISVTASNACGTSAVQTLSVTVNTVPSTPGAISGLTTMCTGATSTNYSVAAIAGATSYTWSLASGWSGSSSTNIISATPGTSGVFSVTATNACGTSPVKTLSVTVNSLPTITVNSGTICSGKSFTITPSGANTYTIQGGSTIVSPATSTNYTVIGTSAAGCVSSAPATSSVTVNATPTITVNSGSICSGQSFTIIPNGANTYTIQGGSAIVSPVTNTNYAVSGTSSQGCVSSSPAITSVTVNALPTVIANTSNTIICGPPFQGTATITASGASTYVWNTSATTTAIAVSPSITTVYTVTGTDVNGCVNSTTFTQSVSACTGINQQLIPISEIIIYPNPTSGELNVLSKKDNENLELTIRDVSGKVIDKHTLLVSGFIGKLGLDLANGVYFITITNQNHESITKKLVITK